MEVEMKQKIRWSFSRSFINPMGDKVLCWKGPDGNEVRCMAWRLWGGNALFAEYPKSTI